jgi:hypothetical protein
MIDPQHSCSWSRKRLTEVGVVDSAFLGAGVPLRVLAHALPDRDTVWYSKVYGEYDDNVFLVGLDRATADSVGGDKLSEAAPLSTALGNNESHEEYGLSTEIEAKLGIVCDEAQYSIRDEALVKYRVHLHDDCFFRVELIDAKLLRELVCCILQQHSFYLGVEIDWSGAIDPVVNIIGDSERIGIQSDPTRKQLTIFQAKTEGGFIRRLLRQRPLASLTIRNGRAELESWD